MRELAHHRFGTSLSPTCKGATFQFGNPDFSRFLQGMSVSYPFDLDSHAVLVGEYDFPANNPQVWKWLVPRSFDDLEVDHHHVRTAHVPADVLSTVNQAIDRQDLSAAFNLWSQSAEHTLLEATRIDGVFAWQEIHGQSWHT